MTWLWVLLGAAALLLLAGLVEGELCVRSVTKAVRRDDEYVRRQETGGGFGEALGRYDREWDRRPFTLESNGVTLSGEYVLNPADSGRPRRVVILCHGHTVNRLCAVKYADLFYRAGYSLVLYDERYFGRSSGKCCTLGQEEAKDLINVMAYTRTVFGKDCLIGLHGESMGAATVLLCLEREKPDFVIADCPFASSTLLFRHVVRDQCHLPAFPILPLAAFLGRVQFGYDFPAVNPIRAVEGADVPICFMHGEADSLIPCEHSRMMYAKCRDPRSRLHLFPGAEHACSIASDPARYERLVLEFLNECVDAASDAKAAAAEHKEEI